ncbi:ankyrin [Cenococcum geophilum 1.58]|uniref:Ankyrin n=1 Tax=Cenococcum geophilum 1.58 TaxID=794803 RepID=A0ACC8ENI8_9PEZI|nr:ankyrin [Cenococcum geophilum 1.58]
MPETETDFTRLHYAATRDNQNTAEVAYNINPQTLKARTSEGHTPLHIAAKFGQEEAIRQLLNARANVDARDNNGQTPLSLCACYDVEPIIPQLLVDANADVNALDSYSWTPVFWTCFRDFDRTYDVLRGQNAKLNVTDNKLKTPLHWAAETGSVKVMEKMLEADRFLDL